MQFMIVTDKLRATGGLLRFERFGRAIPCNAHTMTYAALSDSDREFETAFPVYDIRATKNLRCDVCMVPGKGFSGELIDSLHIFRHENFGLRVQHILNDSSQLNDFLRVNQIFKPHLVVFNNDGWSRKSKKKLTFGRQHYVPGAVDTTKFTPTEFKRISGLRENFVVGGLANKNPRPLIKALKYLPGNFCVKLYGKADISVKEEFSPLIASGRLMFEGVIPECKLYEFYNSVNAVVSTETYAGWSNLIAEAMASGVPVICTRPGTTAFAKHGVNCLILPKPSPPIIAAYLFALGRIPWYANVIAKRGRQSIQSFSWNKYAQTLIKIADEEIRELGIGK